MVDDGRVAPQRLQRLGVRGVAALRLFARGQAQVLKQRLAQLLGAVDVELVPDDAVNGGELLLERGGELVPEGLDARLVHQDAAVLHVGQHRAQRQLDVAQQSGHALRLARAGERLAQRGHQRRVGRFVAAKIAFDAVLARKAGGRVVAGGGVEQIGRELCVERDILRRFARGQRRAEKRFCVKAEFFRARVGAKLRQCGAAVLKKPDAAALRGVPAAGRGAQVHPAAKRRGRRRAHGRVGARVGRFRLLQIQLCQRGEHLALCEQRARLFGVGHAAAVRAGRRVDGRGAHDARQRAAHLGLLAPGLQLCAHALFDARVVQMPVHALQRAERLDQRQRRLFADARHAGDVVGAVAHQAFHVDHLRGGHAVALAHGVLVDALGLRALVLHAHGPAHQLEAVAVARGDDALVAARAARGGQRAQDVVGFVPLARDDLVAQRRQHLLEHGHLGGQLVRHALALGFVARVHLVAEGRGFQIEGHGHLVGRLRAGEFCEDIEKTDEGVGVAPVAGGQQLDAVERAVDDAVAVDGKQFHSAASFCEKTK